MSQNYESMLLFSYALGVTTTVFGAWVASKFHVYHEARGEHYEELKRSVLLPIRTALRDEFSDPMFATEWATKQYNVDARAQDDPSVSGLALTGSAQVDVAQFGDSVLYQDAAEHHYPDLIRSWERLFTLGIFMSRSAERGSRRWLNASYRIADCQRPVRDQSVPMLTSSD